MVGARSRGGLFYDEGVGPKMREARRQQGLSLDDVAIAIRVPPAQLQSLEEGNLAAFSAEVYARGAYRKYAAYLGIDTDQQQQAFFRSLSGVREMVPLRLPQTASWLARVWTPAGMVVLGALGCLMLVGGYLAWQVQSFVRVPELQLTAPESAIVDGRTVTLQGSTEPEVRLTVNGETVLLNEDNTFAVMLPLQRGINLVRLTATGAAGRSRVITRHLLVPRS